MFEYAKVNNYYGDNLEELKHLKTDNTGDFFFILIVRGSSVITFNNKK